MKKLNGSLAVSPEVLSFSLSDKRIAMERCAITIVSGGEYRRGANP
ncbi:hypothetical protein [Desulfosporosinus sp. I2]|nr:hypothetical protein [Desulfosporosinus sp. I2]